MTFVNEISYTTTTHQPNIGIGVDVMYRMFEENEFEIIGRILWSDSMERYHFTPEQTMTYWPWTAEQMQEITDKVKEMNLNHKPKEEDYEL
jgi:hypothetical protein